MFNLVMLAFAYYQLFMRKSTLPEKIVLSLLMLVVVIGNGTVLYQTDISLSELIKGERK
ncbi:hypothetical protein IEO70_13095 [Bacillus sp. AGMB 02131]|uniref:Uncharacterized protein n=1 Tax=Peribacillus faecalis TaxID=2772559 RepID=A0A927HC53_9BACI|nr:hypothetical protein [Peribacillus faecalis]MBD3109282.1 hypothetical protein [Peribacillus faecalis]